MQWVGAVACRFVVLVNGRECLLLLMRACWRPQLSSRNLLIIVISLILLVNTKTAKHIEQKHSVFKLSYKSDCTLSSMRIFYK